MPPLGLLLVVIKILGVVKFLKYSLNSSISYSPLISSSSALVINVSSATLIDSIVLVIPFGAASSPSSSLTFFFFNLFINFILFYAYFFLITTSYFLCLFLISDATLRIGLSLEFLEESLLIFLLNYS